MKRLCKCFIFFDFNFQFINLSRKNKSKFETFVLLDYINKFIKFKFSDFAYRIRELHPENTIKNIARVWNIRRQPFTSAFLKKDVLRNFTKFFGKPLYQCFFNFIEKLNFANFHRATVLENNSGQLFLISFVLLSRVVLKYRIFRKGI